jgi:ribosomal protein S18 acetylase RimI-like enzyme
VEIDLSFRLAQPVDLPDLGWTGGPAHQLYVAAALDAQLRGEVEVLVGEVNGLRLVAFGAVDFRVYPDAGKLWMLIVDDSWRGLGVGRLLLEALEARVRSRGLPHARLQVEHDNPVARGVYESCGYTPIAEETDSWTNEDGPVTVNVTLMQKVL